MSPTYLILTLHFEYTTSNKKQEFKNYIFPSIHTLTMALYDILYSCNLLQCVDILCIVSEQFVVLFNKTYKSERKIANFNLLDQYTGN